MKKPYRQVDKIYGYVTMKVPRGLRDSIKIGAEDNNMSMIDYLGYVVTMEAESKYKKEVK